MNGSEMIARIKILKRFYHSAADTEEILIIIGNTPSVVCVHPMRCMRHQTEPKPFYITVGHLNVGSVGRLIPTMSCKMLGKGPT